MNVTSLVKSQAMDRCHRIGQTRPVLVFRLATAGSVEGKLLARAGCALCPSVPLNTRSPCTVRASAALVPAHITTSDATLQRRCCRCLL